MTTTDISKAYICANGHGFIEPGWCEEREGGYTLGLVACCPECGTTDFSVANRCDWCGEVFHEDEQHKCK